MNFIVYLAANGPDERTELDKRVSENNETLWCDV